MSWTKNVTDNVRGLAARWLPQNKTEHAAIYVSGSAVACAHLTDPHAESALAVAMRADPIKQLADVPGVLQTQAASLGHAGGFSGANLVLAPELYNLALVERPDVADEEVCDAVRWNIQDQVDYPVETATLDVFELPNSASRERPMVYVVAIETEFLQTLLNKVLSAGMQVASVDVAELALRNLVWRCFPQADQSIAMLRLTGNSGMISISRGDELYLARRISGVPRTLAEDAWEEFKERMVLQVQRSIDYYESAMNQPHCNVLMAACTHGWSARVCEHLNEMLAIPIREVSDLIKDEVDLTLFNPDRIEIDWDNLSDDEVNAIAAGLPAIGGVLRQQIRQAAEAA